MGIVSSNASETHMRIVEVLKAAPFMQMMDDKIINELAGCFQLVRYTKGALIKNDPWLFFIVADGAVDISSLIPTTNHKQQLREVLCQRRIGDHISFAAREQILGRLMDEQASTTRREAQGAVVSRTVRKNLMAMLDMNRITADLFTGCTLLKLHRDRFLKLRNRLSARRYQPQVNHTQRFSDEGDDKPLPNNSGKSNTNKRRGTVLTVPEKISLLSSIVESDIVNFLFDIPFLEGVDQSRLATLSNLCSYIFIRKGEVLCQQGEIGDKFFICIRGYLQASVESVLRHNNTADVGKHEADADGISNQTNSLERKMQALKKIGPGAYFGEISLLFKIPRICSIVANTDSLLVYIDRVAFCNFLKIVPQANLLLLEHVRLNFLDILIKQGCSFLNAIPLIKRQELSSVSEITEHFTNDFVIETHAKRPCFYIVLRGEVEVEYSPLQRVTNSKPSDWRQEEIVNDLLPKDDSANPPITPTKEVIRILPGGYFGHEAIILNEPSPISVKALDHTLLLRLTPDVFYDFFASAPALYAEFCIKCLRDKSRPEHVMQHYYAHTLWAVDCVNRRQQNELKLFESIEDFMWEADLAEENIHELALTVYLRYLTEKAPLHVHISPSTLEKLERDLSSHDIDRNVFAAARSEILTRMEDAHFDTFKQSALFQEFLSMLHCPQMIYDGLTCKRMARLDMSHAERGSAAYIPDQTTLELEDVDEDVSHKYERRPKLMENSQKGIGASTRSFGRMASQKRYLVATDPMQTSTTGAVNGGRRPSRNNGSGLQRMPSSLVSTTFVL